MATGRWLGVTSPDWNDASNWCGGIPVATSDITIPSTAPNQPVIGTLGGICRNITIETGASLAITGSNALSVYGNWTNNGTFTANSSTVSFVDSGAAQTITGGATFFNLTLNSALGAVAGSDITVNGVLNLSTASPDETKGTLEMTKTYGDYSNILTPPENLTTQTTQAHDILDSWILYMGATATTTGQGDVTGKVKRTTIADNVEYTFGSPFTSITFNQNGGTLPSAVMFVITKGSDRGIHSNKTNTVARLYQIIRTGECYPTTFSVNFHYLESELNGNTESNLVLWDHHIPYNSSATPHEHGKSQQNATDNWISLIGHDVGYLGSQEVVGGFTKYWMISNSLNRQ
jgi:hypothetical protein